MDEHPEFEEAYDAGPAGLVAHALEPIAGTAYSRLARATVIHLFRFLAKRELNLDPLATDSEVELLDALATDFTTTDDLPGLVRAIVTSDAFGRTP